MDVRFNILSTRADLYLFFQRESRTKEHHNPKDNPTSQQQVGLRCIQVLA